MRRFLASVAVGGLLLLFGWYFIVPFFRYNAGEAGELYDGYVVNDQKQADAFFDRLDNALKSEGFQKTGGPTQDSIFISSQTAQTYWYRGNYRGSLPLTVTVMRDGPRLNCFHVSYCWNYQGFSDIQSKMRQSTGAMSAFLRVWSESHGASDFYNRGYARQP